jgi:prophage DNA circulation protein
VYFIGPDYDTYADRFYQGLRKHGRGKLMHPRWGDRDVLPVTFGQVEHFVDGIRCATFQVDFIEAPDPRALTVTTTTASAIQSAATVTADAASAAMGAQMEGVSALETVKLKGAALDGAASATGILKTLTANADEVRSRMAAAQRAIEREIDTLAIDPIDLTDSMIQLIRMPANIVTSIVAKARGYAELIAGNLITLVGLTIGAAYAWVTNLLGASIAMAESTTTGTLASRAEAMDTYNILTDSTASALAAVEEYIEDPAVLAALQQLTSDARARLLVESYSLPTERCMALKGDSDPITLAYQLYGDPERYIDIIEQNHLADSQIFVIPRGTEIRWYE